MIRTKGNKEPWSVFHELSGQKDAYAPFDLLQGRHQRLEGTARGHEQYLVSWSHGKHSRKDLKKPVALF